MARMKNARDRMVNAQTVRAAKEALGRMIPVDAILREADDLTKTTVGKMENGSTWEIRLTLPECGDEAAKCISAAMLTTTRNKRVRIYIDHEGALANSEKLSAQLGINGMPKDAFHSWPVALSHLPEIEGVNWKHDFSLKEVRYIYLISDPMEAEPNAKKLERVGLSEYHFRQLRKKPVFQKAVDGLISYFNREIRGLSYQALVNNLKRENAENRDIRLGLEIVGDITKKGPDVTVNVNAAAQEQLGHMLTPEDRAELAKMMLEKAEIVAVSADGEPIEKGGDAPSCV